MQYSMPNEQLSVYEKSAKNTSFNDILVLINFYVEKVPVLNYFECSQICNDFVFKTAKVEKK